MEANVSGSVRGKSVIITGTGRGFGAETARDLAKNGGNVCAAGRDLESARLVAKETGKTAIVANVGDEFSQPFLVGRYSKPEDIAAVATFLASTGPDYVKGQTFVADGAWC